MANERLRDALLKAGVTPAGLADKLEVNPKSVERWITLDRIPYPRHRHAISTLLSERESYLWPTALPTQKAIQVAESEIVQVYPRRAAVPADLWGRLLEDSQQRISMLVYAALFLAEQQPNLIKTLKAKAKAGVTVELLMGDPASDAIARRGEEEGIGDAVASRIQNVLAFYSKLRGVPGVEARLHGTPLYNSIFVFDDEMLVNTHIYSFPASHTPVLHLRRLSSGDLFDTYIDSFTNVWDGAKPMWPGDMAQ